MVEAEAGIIAGFGEPVVWEREFNPNLPVKKVEKFAILVPQNFKWISESS